MLNAIDHCQCDLVTHDEKVINTMVKLLKRDWIGNIIQSSPEIWGFYLYHILFDFITDCKFYLYSC